MYKMWEYACWAMRMYNIFNVVYFFYFFEYIYVHVLLLLCVIFFSNIWHRVNIWRMHCTNRCFKYLDQRFKLCYKMNWVHVQVKRPIKTRNKHAYCTIYLILHWPFLINLRNCSLYMNSYVYSCHAYITSRFI